MLGLCLPKADTLRSGTCTSLRDQHFLLVKFLPMVHDPIQVSSVFKIKRPLLLGRKAMANLGSILKSRDISLPTKVHLVKAMVFPVIMYGCERWTIKKAEH